MLRYSVSKDEISIEGISIWDYMFDCFRHNNFCSPQTINATIMGSKGEHYCPTLSAYLRSHFWGRYRRSALESNTLIPVLLFIDLYSENIFTKDQQFVDLEKHYKKKGISIIPYSDERLEKNKLTLFSKGIPSRLLAKLAERINSADDLLQELSSLRAEGHYLLIMEALKSKLPQLFTSIDLIQRVLEQLPEATRLFVVKGISKQPILFITSMEKCQFYVNLFSTEQVKDVIPSINIGLLIQTIQDLEKLLLAIPLLRKREVIFWSFNSSILQCSEEAFNDLASSIELNVACSLSNKFFACLRSRKDWQNTLLGDEIRAISTCLLANSTKNLIEIKSLLREYMLDDKKHDILQSSRLVNDLFSSLEIHREINSHGMRL